MFLFLVALSPSSLFLPPPRPQSRNSFSKNNNYFLNAFKGSSQHSNQDQIVICLRWHGAGARLGVLGSERWGGSRPQAGERAGERWQTPNGSGAIGARRGITTLF